MVSNLLQTLTKVGIVLVIDLENSSINLEAKHDMHVEEIERLQTPSSLRSLACEEIENVLNFVVEQNGTSSFVMYLLKQTIL